MGLAADRLDNWSGMNWIRKEKRLAIYLRDGLRCVYCQMAVKECTLSLDHLDANGPNDAENLVTCCTSCNAGRQGIDWMKFANAQAILTIPTLVSRPLDLVLARALLHRSDWDWTATLELLEAK
jgi:hypothetical protein